MVFSPMRLLPATAVNTAALRLSCTFCHGVPVLSGDDDLAAVGLHHVLGDRERHQVALVVEGLVEGDGEGDHSAGCVRGRQECRCGAEEGGASSEDSDCVTAGDGGPCTGRISLKKNVTESNQTAKLGRRPPDSRSGLRRRRPVRSMPCVDRMRERWSCATARTPMTCTSSSVAFGHGRHEQSLAPRADDEQEADLGEQAQQGRKGGERPERGGRDHRREDRVLAAASEG